MLVIDNIEVVYQNVVLALKDVSMHIPDGKIVILLGNNGSGKSTVLKSISGVLGLEDGKLKQGKIELDEKRIDILIPEKVARLGICHVMQGHPVFDDLTVEENLLMGAYLQHDHRSIRQDLSRVFGYFPKLEPLKARKSGYLSGGEQQMLVIGRALMARPKIMLLDEPSLGLASKIINEIFSVIKQINQEQKTTFLISEQNAQSVLPIADYGYLLQAGRIVLEGPDEVLRPHQDVRRSYLGSDGEDGQPNYYAYIRKKRTRDETGGIAN